MQILSGRCNVMAGSDSRDATSHCGVTSTSGNRHARDVRAVQYGISVCAFQIETETSTRGDRKYVFSGNQTPHTASLVNHILGTKVSAIFFFLLFLQFIYSEL